MNGAIRKRKTKRGSRVKKGKRSKLFQEKSFDSSDDENSSEIFAQQFEQNLSLRPSKCDSSTPKLKHSVNLTPSKSECETAEVCKTDESCSYVSYISSNNSFNISSDETDEEAACITGSVLDQFVNYSDADKSAEIISVELQHPDCEKSQDIHKKTKRKKTVSVSDEDNELKNTKSWKKNKTRKISLSVINKNDVLTEQAEIKIEEDIHNEVRNGIEIEECRIQIEKPFVDKHINKFNHEDQLYYTSDGIIVVLAKQQKIYFHGLCLLHVLHGRVEVLGHILTKDSSEAKLYSLRGSSLLYLQNVTEIDTPVKNYLPNLKLSEKCAVILCKQLIDMQISFIEKHISQQILPREERNFPRVIFEPEEGSWNLLEVNPEWENIIEGINNKTRMIICGGKGVGKTTFLRYTINKLLLKFSDVKVIDLDPGQSEFTIPGCISIVRVTKPIFGVSYTHLQAAERSVLSNINIGYEPDKYIASVEQLLKTSLDEVPTLVNYMGYTHGIGINILSAVIVSVQPSDIVQISSQDPKKNYKMFLTKNVIEENAKLFVQTSSDLNYTFHQIMAMSDKNAGWTAEPRQLREMCVLSFISTLIQSSSLFNNRAPLYRINLDEITLSDFRGEKIHPAAINACLVALCATENEKLKIFKCMGWGIVKGIDLSSNELVLLTCEKLEILDQVTHLVSSGATLPPSIYMTPDEVIGAIPYVIEGGLVSFGQIPKRSRISVNQRRT